MSKYRYRNGRRVSKVCDTTEGKRLDRRRATLIERGNILSLADTKAINRCCKRRGIRCYSYANSSYTEVEGVKFY